MNLSLLSDKYRVGCLQEKDIPQILGLCKGNPQYYHYCPPFVSEASIRKDMRALPPGKKPEDKFYLGFWDGEKLVAILDLILGFPNAEIAFWGFFMVDAGCQKKGIGSQIVGEVLQYLSKEFLYVRLGYVQGNSQSEHFWKKNGFEATGVISHTQDYDIVIMQRWLQAAKRAQA